MYFICKLTQTELRINFFLWLSKDYLMLKYFFILFWVLLLLQPEQSLAQLDLDALMQDTPAEDASERQKEDTAEVQDMPEKAQTADSKELVFTQTSETIDKPAKEISVPQKEADNIEFPIAPQEDSVITDRKPENSEQNSQENKQDEEDFLIEYFEEVDAAEAQDKAAQKAQRDAYRLIEAEPAMVTISEDQQKLLQRAEKYRKQHARELLKKQKEVPDDKEKNTLQNTKQPDNIPEKISEITLETETDTKPETTAETAAKQEMPIFIETPNTQKPKPQKKAEPENNKAPFGLYWGMSKEEAENLGFEFRVAKLENQTNVYAAENAKQPQKTFASVVTVFGEKDHLNAIYAEGFFMADTPRADNVLKLYDRYYAALKKKYGGAREYFRPNTYEEQIPAENKQGNTLTKEKNSLSTKNAQNSSQTIKKQSPRGNDNFLQELQEEKASLFATFGDEKIRVTLAVDVNQKSQSRITLDYENLKIQQQDKEIELNELMENL